MRTSSIARATFEPRVPLLKFDCLRLEGKKYELELTFSLPDISQGRRFSFIRASFTAVQRSEIALRRKIVHNYWFEAASLAVTSRDEKMQLKHMIGG